MNARNLAEDRRNRNSLKLAKVLLSSFEHSHPFQLKWYSDATQSNEVPIRLGGHSFTSELGLSRKKKPKRNTGLGRESLKGVEKSVASAANRERTASKSPAKSGRNKQVHKIGAGREKSVRVREKRPVELVPFSQAQFRSAPFALWTVAFLAAFLFAFWPTLVWLEQQWRNEADYSHGYLIVPLALILLWLRWDTFPGITRQVDWRGLSLIGVAIAMRFVGRLAYMDFLDGYAIVPFVAGICWTLFGLPAMKWASPAILFLVMMVPLPYQAESLLSFKLQGIATTISTGMLRIVGLPAIAEGHAIWIGDSKLQIEEACSGLRIFVGMIALSFFWAATVKRSWLDRVVIIASAIPMALFVNSLRITVTGLLYQWFESPAARKTIHDWTGFLMIPLAAALLWLIKCYWERLYRPVEVIGAGELIRKTSTS